MSHTVPEFLIAGAPRCGTTWLYHLLERHPGIYMAKPVRPEPKFFLVDETYARGLDWYLSTWFADVPTGRIAGEKSTNYFESPQAAARIAEHLPNVKLIFIFRNPVERAWSNYCWSRMNGLEHESFERALELEPKREHDCPEQLRFARPFAYFARGLYAEQLRPWFERFDRDQICLLSFEDIAADPEDLAVRLHRFLEIEQRGADAAGLGAINPSEADGLQLADATRRQLAARYAQPNQELAALADFDVTRWGNAA